MMKNLFYSKAMREKIDIQRSELCITLFGGVEPASQPGYPGLKKIGFYHLYVEKVSNISVLCLVFDNRIHLFYHIQNRIDADQKGRLLNRQINRPTFVMPDLIRDRVSIWIPVFAGKTFTGVFSCRVNKKQKYVFIKG